MPDEASVEAERIIGRLTGGPAQAPALLLQETANALLQAERRARVPAATATELLSTLLTLPLLLDPVSPEALARALDLARSHGLSVYDAVYLDLAEQRGLPLATFDAQLVRVAREPGIELLSDSGLRSACSRGKGSVGSLSV